MPEIGVEWREREARDAAYTADRRGEECARSVRARSPFQAWNKGVGHRIDDAQSAVIGDRHEHPCDSQRSASIEVSRRGREPSETRSTDGLQISREVGKRGHRRGEVWIVVGNLRACFDRYEKPVGSHAVDGGCADNRGLRVVGKLDPGHDHSLDSSTIAKIGTRSLILIGLCIGGGPRVSAVRCPIELRVAAILDDEPELVVVGDICPPEGESRDRVARRLEIERRRRIHILDLVVILRQESAIVGTDLNQLADGGGAAIHARVGVEFSIGPHVKVADSQPSCHGGFDRRLKEARGGVNRVEPRRRAHEQRDIRERERPDVG